MLLSTSVLRNIHSCAGVQVAPQLQVGHAYLSQRTAETSTAMSVAELFAGAKFWNQPVRATR